MAVRKLFNDGWLFRKEAGGKFAGDWKSVDVPHDWLIYDSMNLYESSTGQYKKEFKYKKLCGERAFIRFDGVYMDTVVHVNGIQAAEWKYGYSTLLKCPVTTGRPTQGGIREREFTAMCGL